MAVERREIAYYYPNPMWVDGDWIKSLILFFDGIALLVPEYLLDKPDRIDPAIVAGLRQHKLLHIIEPEQAIGKHATEQLATAMTDIITSGMLDDLAEKPTAFHELSMSRLGYYGDQGLARMIFDELKARGLARDSEDTKSIPMHPMVRSLVLVLLSQIVRPYGETLGANLCPVTDQRRRVLALGELLAVKEEASVGRVIEFDLGTVSVDLGPVPIDEVLAFRAENLSAHRHYSLSAKKFAMELSRMPEEEQQVAFELRKTELDELAGDLSKRAQKAWKKPTSLALSLLGAALSATTSQYGAAIRALAAVAGYDKGKGVDAGAYSYLFNARARFGG